MAAFSLGLSLTCSTCWCVPAGLYLARSARLIATTRVLAYVRYKPLLSGSGVGCVSTNIMVTIALLVMRAM